MAMDAKILNTFLIVLTFVNGFLVSRILIKCNIAESIVLFFIKKSKGHFLRILIYLTLSSAFLSLFIPNMIALLAILPILQILKKDLESLNYPQGFFDTSLSLSTLYGANIGGTGSLIGSPSNLILLGFLIINDVSGTQQINFVSWLGWGVPLVLCYCLFVFLIIRYLLISPSLKKAKIPFNLLPLSHSQQKLRHKKIGTFLSLFTLVFFVFLPLLNFIHKEFFLPITALLAFIFTIFFIVFLFFISVKEQNSKNSPSSPLLIFKDCYTNLPGKGFLIAGIAVVFSALMVYLKVDKFLVGLVKQILPTGVHPFWVMFVLSLMVVFISEFISNTATAVTFFILALPLAKALEVSPFPFLLGISLVSTVPSMSPVASPVNAMAFGGLPKVQLKKMFFLGFFIDIVGAFLISFFATFIIPYYYALN